MLPIMVVRYFYKYVFEIKVIMQQFKRKSIKKTYL
jgi:hypothetical protein